MKIIEIEDRTDSLLAELLELWEKSVRATHLFLNESDIQNIKKYVPEALKNVPHLIYEHLGFVTYKRTELDEQGNPFPILYMKKAKAS